jgi:hypothetical protein
MTLQATARPITEIIRSTPFATNPTEAERPTSGF